MRKITKYTDHEIQWEVPMSVIQLEMAGQPQADPIQEALNGD